MDFKAVCVLNLVFLFISVHCTFYIGPLTFPFPSLASLLSCQPSTHYRPEPCRPTRSRGLGDCEPSSISFGILLFFFPFYSRRFVWKRNDNKAADLRDSPRRRERTDVPRRRAENDASNSWAGDRFWGGWPIPQSADVSLKEQRLHVIYFWLPGLLFIYLSSTKGKAKLCLKWQASWLTFQLVLVLHLFSSSLKTWKEIAFTHYENLITILVTLQ